MIRTIATRAGALLTATLISMLLIPVSGAPAAPPAVSFHSVTERIRHWSQPWQVDLDTLDYDPEPWLTDRDMVVWDTGAGRIVLRGDKSDHLGRLDPGLASDGFMQGLIKGFVVCVDGEPVQLGACVSALSSMIPAALCLHTMQVRFGNDDEIVLRSHRREAPPLEPAITARLVELGLAGGGRLRLEVEEIGIATLEGPPALEWTCGVVLVNEGPEDLLVLDPARIRPGFTGYGAGLHVTSEESPVDRSRQRLRMADWNREFDTDWLVHLPAGAELRREFKTVTRRLAGTEYGVRVTYPGVHDLPADWRRRDGAWVWPHPVTAESTVRTPSLPGDPFHAVLDESQVLYLAGKRVEEIDMVLRPDGALAVNDLVFRIADARDMAAAIRGFCNAPACVPRVLVVTAGGVPYPVRCRDGDEAMSQIRAVERDGTILPGPLPAECLREIVP